MDILSVNVIKKIKEVEEKAENLRGEVKIKAQAIVDDAKKKTKEIINKAKEEGRVEKQSIIDKAKEEGERKAQLIKRENENEREELRKKGLSNLDKAVSFIVERLLKTETSKEKGLRN
ncbi:MAG: hypothetical protein COS84_09445 [Armatimonadetes bacterium CG07_land_8_20_14_0_80_40_9]|nr:MAG: hypothetical protein COS84_09445 [Armatimonadetes bacterium CG07_land_8_20_14_0_80_40_9]